MMATPREQLIAMRAKANPPEAQAAWWKGPARKRRLRARTRRTRRMRGRIYPFSGDHRINPRDEGEAPGPMRTYRA